MKKIIAILIASSMMMTVNAQQKVAKDDMQTERQERFEKFGTALNLTPEQKEKIKQIRVQTRENMMKNKTQSREAQQKLRANAESEIKNVLTPEQQEKYNELMAEKKAEGKEMRNGGQGCASAAASSGGRSCCQKGQGGAKKSCSGK